MGLKKVTLLTIIAISFIFISKSMATFAPGFYSGIRVAKVNSTLLLVASLVVVAFFAVFYQKYAAERAGTLKLASMMAFLAASVTSLVLFTDVLSVMNLLKIELRLLRPAVDMFYAIMLLNLFIVFYKTSAGALSAALNQACYLVVVGFAISSILQSYIFISILFFDEIRLPGYDPPGFPLLLIPVFIFMFFTKFYYFLTFYRELE